MRFNSFKQPNWTEASDEKSLSTSTSKAISFLSEADNQTSNIQIRALYLPGFTGFPVPVVSNSYTKILYNRIRAVNKNKVNLSIVKAGSYKLSVFSVNGKQISSVNHNLSTAGSHLLSLKGINSRGLYVIKVAGEDISMEKKLLVR